MYIQYASDLHLEFPVNEFYLERFPLHPKGDILVLAGDIVPFSQLDKHQDFFDWLSEHFKLTYWLPGNHEYYHFDLNKKQGRFKEAIRENIFLVNNVSVVHENVQLIFSTLWSKISVQNAFYIERNMSDFHVISVGEERFTADKCTQLHQESMAFIQSEITKSSALKKLVFTHHCPTFQYYPEKYKGSILNEAFATELSDYIESSGIDYWIYGHHHQNTPDFKIGKTILVTNQLGYVQMDEQKGFSVDKCIEV